MVRANCGHFGRGFSSITNITEIRCVGYLVEYNTFSGNKRGHIFSVIFIKCLAYI